MSLSNKEKRFLRGLTHNLQPVVSIANKGLTANVSAELETALGFHELIKVKIRCDREQRTSLVKTICDEFHAELVHAIGQVASFYRSNPEKPRIEFP